jgi:hypothetical protein
MSFGRRRAGLGDRLGDERVQLLVGSSAGR